MKIQKMRRKVSFKLGEDFVTLYIPNFDSYFTDFQPKPSTSRAYNQAKKKENSKLEATADIHTISSGEDEDLSGFETSTDTEDDGKKVDYFSIFDHTLALISILLYRFPI